MVIADSGQSLCQCSLKHRRESDHSKPAPHPWARAGVRPIFFKLRSPAVPKNRSGKYLIKETRRITHNSIFADYLLPPSDFVRLCRVTKSRIALSKINVPAPFPATYKPIVEIHRTIGSRVSQRRRTSGWSPDPASRDEHISQSHSAVNSESSFLRRFFAGGRLG